MRLASPPVARRVVFALSLLMVLATLPGAVAAATRGLSQAEHRLDVSGDMEIAVTGLMPGDRGPVQTIDLHATGAIRYQVRVVYTGSPALAAVLELSLTRPDGSVLYRGPLAGATVRGPTWPTVADPSLADGEKATILAGVRLPLSAGNEVQGASLRASIIVVAVEDPSP